MTYQEFVNKYNGVGTDYDGVAGVQCVDLIKLYLNKVFGLNPWFCQYHLTHFIRTRIMQRERYDHSRAFFGLPEAAHRWRCRFFC